MYFYLDDVPLMDALTVAIVLIVDDVVMSVPVVYLSASPSPSFTVNSQKCDNWVKCACFKASDKCCQAALFILLPV